MDRPSQADPAAWPVMLESCPWAIPNQTQPAATMMDTKIIRPAGATASSSQGWGLVGHIDRLALGIRNVVFDFLDERGFLVQGRFELWSLGSVLFQVFFERVELFHL